MARKRRGASTSTSTSAAPPPPKSAACGSVLELPHELIVGILLGLPAKSLFRFRCVSKSWDALFYDPRFLKQHSNSLNRKSALHRKLMTYNGEWFNSFGVPALCRDKSQAVCHEYVPLPNNLRFKKRDPTIVGCCNGVFCLEVHGKGKELTIYFWNPLTKLTIKLPYDFSRYYDNYDLRENVFGFGFDESTNEFKLVRIFVDISSNNKSKDMAVEVYGMWEGCRKRISNFPCGLRPYHSYLLRGVCLNGALHWVANNNNPVHDDVSKSKRSWAVVALDLAKETFQQVLLPDQVANRLENAHFRWEYDLRLYCVGELLCLVTRFHRGVEEVWMMEEYGVKESWIKLVTIRAVPADPLDPLCLPISFSKINDGQLLMILQGKLVLFDLKQHSYEDLKIYHINNYYNSLIYHTYVETLFTPSVMMGLRGESYQQQRWKTNGVPDNVGVITWCTSGLRQRKSIARS